MNAVITGASKGIGKAIALKLAENGYNLAICARNEAELQSFTTELLALGVKVIAVVVDCSKKDEVISFCNQVKSEMKTIEVLVNNVGVFLPGNILDEADDAFEQQQQLNLALLSQQQQLLAQLNQQLQQIRQQQLAQLTRLQRHNKESMARVMERVLLMADTNADGGQP